VTAPPVQRWFFVHMQKTAGTTLYRRLRSQFPLGSIYPTPDDQHADPGPPRANVNVDLLRRRLDERGEHLRVVTGHFPLCVTDMLDVPFTVITVLREPVERTLSALRDMREREPRFRGWPLERIYEDPVRFHCVLENHMVKMLAIRPDEMTSGPLSPLAFEDRHLDLARRALDDRIDTWGLQEDFDGFCDQLSERYGWDLGRPRVTNVSKPFEVDDAFRARIARDNRLDVELYRYALERRRQRLATSPA
jgi:hypothetical protein